MSSAERFALAGLSLLLLAHAATGFSPAFAEALEYRRADLGAQPWRLLTAHWVHINWTHVLINAAAWFMVARLFSFELTPARQTFVLLIAGVAISAALAAGYPKIEWYRGFSGELHALFFAGATAWLLKALTTSAQRTLRATGLAGALVLGGWIKVALEQPAEGITPYAAWLGATTVPQAHLVGALCGTAIGVAVVLLLLRRGRSAPPLARDQGE
jgi:rhomboid family GlyGly-CTERM serine protease